MHHISITKLKQNTFSEYCGKNVMKRWWQEKNLNHISITILWKKDATSIQHKWWSNWNLIRQISRQFHEKVMEMWWVEISNCFLAFIIWIFPPVKTQCQMPDAGISKPVWVRPMSDKHIHTSDTDNRNSRELACYRWFGAASLAARRRRSRSVVGERKSK